MYRFVTAAIALLLVSPAWAQLAIPSDGSDGALLIEADTTIDLSLAASMCDCDEGGVLNDVCRWDCPSPVEGQGVYDVEKWAIVFKYTSVSITSGELTFMNHSSRAPIVWLVNGESEGDGNVTISGQILLNGSDGAGTDVSEPGPGGFRGGRGGSIGVIPGSGGFGPGGGGFPSGSGAGGGYGSAGSGPEGSTYGNELILPLIGGSGAAGDPTNPIGGGAGAGAILIAAAATVTLDNSPSISARGGSGDRTGSGGAIRIIADEATGESLVASGGGGGGVGRIRIEANSNTVGTANPPASNALPGPLENLYNIWPPEDAPALRATQIDYFDLEGAPQSEPIPDDPDSNLESMPPLQDVIFETDQDITVHIEGINVPLDWTVFLRIVAKEGDTLVIDPDVNGDPLPVGDDTFWTRTITFEMSQGISALQLRAVAPK